MKKFILCFILLIISILCVRAEDKVLSLGVSIDDVPESFFGSWRITAKLDTTNSHSAFKPQSVDIWTLTRTGDIITLDNPFTGAKADVSVRTVEGNLIVFSKKGNYDNKVLTDTVAIRLDESTFKGINTVTLESFSLIDNHLLKTETARYFINGEKIAGENIIK